VGSADEEFMALAALRVEDVVLAVLVGQITSKIGKSFVQDETRRAVDIEDEEAVGLIVIEAGLGLDEFILVSSGGEDTDADVDAVGLGEWFGFCFDGLFRVDVMVGLLPLLLALLLAAWMDLEDCHFRMTWTDPRMVKC
jgi:hypothetical protein